MAAIEKDLRAVPIWLLEKYLEEAGGHSDHIGGIRGDGWMVHLTQMEDYTIGSLSVGEVHLSLKGNEAAIDRVWHTLEPKLVRAGGG